MCREYAQAKKIANKPSGFNIYYILYLFPRRRASSMILLRIRTIELIKITTLLSVANKLLQYNIIVTNQNEFGQWFGTLYNNTCTAWRRRATRQRGPLAFSMFSGTRVFQIVYGFSCSNVFPVRDTGHKEKYRWPEIVYLQWRKLYFIFYFYFYLTKKYFQSVICI